MSGGSEGAAFQKPFRQPGAKPFGKPYAKPDGVLTAHEYPALAHEIFNEPEQHDVLQRVVAWMSRLEPRELRSRT